MIDPLFRLLLSPLLIAQALSVRSRAQLLPEAAGPRHGVTGKGSPLRLRIIGDSSAAGVGAEVQLEALSGQTVGPLSCHFEVHWDLDALTGATTRSTLARLERQPPGKTDIVITALGVNDITRLTRPSQWIVLQQRLWDRIGTLYEPRRIYLSGVPPLAHFPLLPQPLRWTLGRQAAAFEAAMKDHLMQRSDVAYVPFDLPLDPEMMAADGFHPAPRTYALWGKQMASRIISDWPEISNGQELPVTFAQRHPGSPRREVAEAPAGSRGDRQRDRPER